MDAQVLLAHVLAKPRAWALAHPDLVLTPEQSEALEKDLARLVQGEPLPYVVGHWEFFGLDFWVTPATLIPRPETELLVEKAIEWLQRHPQHRRALDVGTGTACIAVALAVRIPDLRVLACDLSPDALQVAQKNITRHGVQDRVTSLQADLLPVEGERFDLICANLPYIPSATLETLDVSRREPSLALDGGPDGLDLIRRLLHRAPGVLGPGGLILLEIEATQGAAAQRLARTVFTNAEVALMQDLAGRDRLIQIQA